MKNVSGPARDVGAVGIIRVWDSFVRFFHWTLVGAIAFCVVSGFLLGAPWIDLHVLAGLLAAALVVERIIWGFLGPRHARFADFVRGPRVVISHLHELLRGEAPAYVGHNPVGGLMVVALIAMVLAMTVTGLVTLGGEFKTGPLAFLDHAIGVGSHDVHRLLAWAMLVLIGLHVAGVVIESLRTGENLVQAMITGRRRVPSVRAEAMPVVDATTDGDPPLAAFASAVVFGSLLAIALAITPREIPGAPVPEAAFPENYASECGDCHKAYNPSILPAASWRKLMAGLEDHFGEDASLDPETTAAIAGWLVAHAAETVDTRPAHLFRIVDPRNPIAASATPAWKSIHGAIPETIFAAAPVYSRSNCFACHEDAADGWYYPGRVEIPEMPAGDAGQRRPGDEGTGSG